MTTDDKIRDEKLQDNINREAAKISALSSGKIDKYEYLRGEEILPSYQSRTIEQVKFKIMFWIYNKNYHQKLNNFKKPNKMSNDFFNNYIFVRTFQWTSSKCYNNVTITAKVALVTYIQCKMG